MATYTPQKILYPCYLDEVGLNYSLYRLPHEDLETLRRKIFIEQRKPSNTALVSYIRSPCHQTGEWEIPIFRVSLTDNSLPAPEIKITSTKFYYYADKSIDPVIETYLHKRDSTWFLRDIFTTLDAIPTLDIEVLDTDYLYRLSSNLRISSSTEFYTNVLLSNSYQTKLPHENIRHIEFTNSTIFQEQKDTLAEVTEDGDFFVDEENGIVFSHNLQAGSCSYQRIGFPFIIWWQPIRVVPLTDTDIDFRLKDLTFTEDLTFETDSISLQGIIDLNQILSVHNTTWGE